MKYEQIKKAAIYCFIVVTVFMSLLGVLAVWGVLAEDVLWRAFATVLVVGLGCISIAYTAGLLEQREEVEQLPSFAPPKGAKSASPAGPQDK